MPWRGNTLAMIHELTKATNSKACCVQTSVAAAEKIQSPNPLNRQQFSNCLSCISFPCFLLVTFNVTIRFTQRFSSNKAMSKFPIFWWNHCFQSWFWLRPLLLAPASLRSSLGLSFPTLFCDAFRLHSP